MRRNSYRLSPPSRHLLGATWVWCSRGLGPAWRVPAHGAESRKTNTSSRPTIDSMCALCSGLPLRYGEAHAQCAPPRCDRRAGATSFRGQRSRGFSISSSFVAAFDGSPSMIAPGSRGGSHRFRNRSTRGGIIRRFLGEPRRWSNTRFCVSTCAAVGHRPAHKVIASTSGVPRSPDQ